MVWRAGGFGGAGKRRTLFSVLFIAFLGPAVRRLGRLCWAWRGRCSPLALDPTVPQVGSGWVIFEARGLPACPRSLPSAPDLVAPLVAPPFRRRAASWGSADVRSAWGPPSFTPSSGDAGG